MLNNIRIEKITSSQSSATIFFWRFKIYYMLDIVPSCNLVQYQGNIMMPPWENGKNPNFRPNLGSPKFFPWVLPLLVVRQCSKLSSNAIIKESYWTKLEKIKKTKFGPNFGLFGPNLGPKTFFGGFISTTS